MIHGIFGTLQEDTSILICWCKGSEINLQEHETKEQRVNIASLRVFSAIGMAAGVGVTIGSLCSEEGSLKLIPAIAGYLISHDMFVMCQNFSLKVKEKFKPSDFFRSDMKAMKVERTHAFTKDTFLKFNWCRLL